MAVHALISIHDVCPATLPWVRSIIEQLPPVCRRHLLLLVIPGRDWSASDIEQLQQWWEQGYILAGHGWQHHCETVQGLYHRLHSLVLSRRAAEHLALSAAEIAQLLQDNHRWFVSQGLEAPSYYVPPAWAMGGISRSALGRSPFRYFETTGGIYDTQTRRFYPLPLVGFEADTTVRQWLLRAWNAVNQNLASRARPLRISIHPGDLDLKLAPQLHQLLAKVGSTHPLDQVFAAQPSAGGH